MIPCSFNKFVETRPVEHREFERKFEGRISEARRGDEIPYSKRILKEISQITDYIPNSTILNGGSPNENH